MVMETPVRRGKEVAWMELRPRFLDAYMVEQGWTNATLAQQLRKPDGSQPTRQYVDALRRGARKTCTPDMATRIAAVLGVPLSELFIPRTSSTKKPAEQMRVPVLTGVRRKR